jgi:hypothetical protein
MKKTFDAVAWMRQRRTQIDEEDAALTWAQKQQKTHEEVLRDPLLAPLGAQTVVPEKAALRTGKKVLSSDRHRRTRARRP